MSQNTPVSFVGKHTFTAEEKEQKLQQMLTAMREKEEIEAELKTAKSNYKSKIDSKDGEIKLMSNLLNVGWENKTYNCNLVKNFEEGKRQYFELGSGNLVGEEPLTAADYQIQMNLEEAAIKANNEAADNTQQPEIESPAEPEEIEPAGMNTETFEEPTPTDTPEAIVKPLKKQPSNDKTIVLEPDPDEFLESPFGTDDLIEDDSDPFNFDI